MELDGDLPARTDDETQVEGLKQGEGNGEEKHAASPPTFTDLKPHQEGLKQGEGHGEGKHAATAPTFTEPKPHQEGLKQGEAMDKENMQQQHPRSQSRSLTGRA